MGWLISDRCAGLLRNATRAGALAALLLGPALLPAAARAATLVELPAGSACKLQLAGEIASGDAARLIALSQDWELEDESTESWRLCLDSPGGNLAEALQIAAYLRERGIGTVLEPGAECLSACALVFMMGFAWGHEEFFINRRMHYTARLGFHRPELVLPPDQRDMPAAAVINAFELALDAALGFVELANKRAEFTDAPMMRADLLERVFSHRGTDFFFIDRVDHLGRWGITLTGVPPPRGISAIAARNACDNLTRWQSGLVADLVPEDMFQSSDLPRQLARDAFLVEHGSDDGMVGHSCVIAFARDGDFASLRACGYNDLRGATLGAGPCSADDWTTRAGYGFPWLALFDAQTRLTDLPALAAMLGAPGAVRPPARISPAVIAFRDACHVEPGQRLRVMHVNEYATLRAAPSFEADIVATIPLMAPVQVLSHRPVFPTDDLADHDGMVCTSMCMTLHRDRSVVGWNRLNQCYVQNRFWYPVSFGGQRGYMSARLLGP